MRKLLLILTLLSFTGLNAQYVPVYSQYYFNGLLINPGYTASKGALTVNGISRTQWVGLEGAPSTQVISAHTPLGNKKMGVGLTFTHDRISIYSTSSASLTYAYRVKMAGGHLSFGIAPGYEMSAQNWSRTISIDPDQIVPAASEKTQQFTVGTGLYFQNKSMFCGLSSPRIYHSKATQSANPFSSSRPVFFTAGYLVNLGNELRLKPSVLVKQYGTATGIQWDANLSFYYKELFGLGFSYRVQESFIGVVQYAVTRNLKLGYSYDYQIGILKGFTGGSHELMLEFILSNKRDAVSPRFF